MSFDTLRAYFRLIRLGLLDGLLDKLEQAVLIYLADMANGKRGQRFTVSYRTIALDCRISERTAQTIMLALVRKSLGLSRDNEATGRRAGEYHFDLERLTGAIKQAEARIREEYPAATLTESVKQFRATRRQRIPRKAVW